KRGERIDVEVVPLDEIAGRPADARPDASRALGHADAMVRLNHCRHGFSYADLPRHHRITGATRSKAMIGPRYIRRSLALFCRVVERQCVLWLLLLVAIRSACTASLGRPLPFLLSASIGGRSSFGPSRCFRRSSLRWPSFRGSSFRRAAL